ncbi:MAG TPA: toll/interleukin-1 receptor domain-containing protein, partial [Ktedonobacterales bacterium]
MTGNGKVFISHAYQDTDACRPLLATLDSWDLTYWFQAERSEVDERLSPQVEQALAEADVFLRVLSAAARGSFWVQLETETFQRLRRDEQANRPEIGADDSTDDST